MPKVSVILPSLNVGKYIRETLDSVCNQTLEDIEIICVDAGSTDGTLECIKEYQNKDSRIQLIHSEKKSYGYQMNIGMDIAKGEYIGIVETDDYIEPVMYERLYAKAKEHNLDIIKSNYRFFFEGNGKKRHFIDSDLAKYSGFEYGTVYSCDDYISGKYIFEIYIWDGIYRKSFLEEKGVRFNETSGASFQDFGFKYLAGFQAKRIMVMNDCYYNYRKDNLEASTYNTKAVGFIINETYYVRDMLKRELFNNGAMYLKLASEFVEAFRSSVREICRWQEADENVIDAVCRFKDLIDILINDGVCSFETIGAYNWKIIQLARKDPEAFLKCARIMLETEAEIALQFINKCSQEEKIVLFGSGAYGKAAHAFLCACQEGDDVIAFVDNNPEKEGNYIDGVEILSLQKCISTNNDALYVIASPANSIEMRQQLLDLGIAEDKILEYNYSNSIFTCVSGINYSKDKKRND